MRSNRNRTALVVAFLVLVSGTARGASGTDGQPPKAATTNADEAAKTQALQAKVAMYKQEAQKARQAVTAYEKAGTATQASDVISPGTTISTPSADQSTGTTGTTSSDSASETPASISPRAVARALWIAKMKARYQKLANLADQLAAAAQEEATFHQQRAAGIQPE